MGDCQAGTMRRERTRRRTWTTVIGSGAVMLGALTFASPKALAAPPTEPLEVVDADVTGFPRVTIDVALPRRELASDVTATSFEAPGASALTVEPLDSRDLTIEIVLDDGPEVEPGTVEIEQGAMAELLIGLPDGVAVGYHTTSGMVVQPTVDRAALFTPLARLGTTAATPVELSAALEAAATRLAASVTARRQLVVVTHAGADLDAGGRARLQAALDTAGAALRAVVIGDEVGPELARSAALSGGASAAVGSSADATVRAADVLTTTFSDQFRLMMTLAAPGSQMLRLTIADRRYETMVPDLGVIPTTTAPATTSPVTTTTSTTTTTTTTTPTTTTPATTAGPSTAAPGTDDSGPAAPPAMATSGAAGASSGVVGLIQAVLVAAALVGIVGIVVWQWRRRVSTRRPAIRRR